MALRVAAVLVVLVVLAAAACLLSSTVAAFEEVLFFGQFDFIVVGAGSAGSVVADRLSECAHHRVLVVDAGDDPPIESLVPSLFAELPATRCDWNFTSEDDHRTAQAHTIRALNLTQGHVLGGGSSVNYMAYVRGCDTDFDPWASAAEDSSWNYESVLPYFLKSERLEDPDIKNSSYMRYHSTTGFLGVTRENREEETAKYLDAFEEVGHERLFDVNGEKKLGYTLALYTIAGGVRQTTALTNLLRANARFNLHILKRTLVTQILFDEHNKAVAIRAITENNITIIIGANKEIIISAGALNTPKLLMNSGIGPKQHLQYFNIPVRSDLPVGFNFQDHVVVMLGIMMEGTNAPTAPTDPRKFPVPVFTGYAALDANETCPNYQSFNMITPHNSAIPYQMCQFNFGIEDSICKNFIKAVKNRNLLLGNVVQLHPRSRGRVLLRSRDPRDPPRVITNTFRDERDLEELTDSIIDYLKVLNSNYFKSVKAEVVDLKLNNCGELDLSSRSYWRCYAASMMSTMYHYSGTCALGAVVDAALRVRRVSALRVADASVMPRLPGGNTNAPTIMLAEKAADMIKATHGYCI